MKANPFTRVGVHKSLCELVSHIDTEVQMSLFYSIEGETASYLVLECHSLRDLGKEKKAVLFNLRGRMEQARFILSFHQVLTREWFVA